ncbi:MAG: prepilin peptidase [Pseudomonadota bacterium]
MSLAIGTFFGSLMGPVLLSAFPLALIAAALTDLQRFIIPNWTSLLLILGFGVAFTAGAVNGALGVGDLATHLGVGLAGFAIGFVLWACGLWGGGDGKLLAAAALWFDPSAVLMMLLWVAVFGGLTAIACFMLVAFKEVLYPLPVVGRLPFEKYSRTVPYGVAIAAGALMALPDSVMFSAVTIGVV